MSQQNDFRDRLIAAQQITPEYREKYERRLESMITKQLTPLQRSLLGFIVLLGIGALVAIAWVLTTDTQTSIQFKYAIGFLGLVVLAITIVRGIAVVTGKVNLRIQPKIIAYLGYFGILIFSGVAVVLAGIGPNGGGTNGIWVVVVTLIPLVTWTGALTMMQMRQSELTLQEKLLELELKLDEISVRLQREVR